VGRRGSFRALHSRPFRLYFAGQVASASGTFLQQTAIGWLVLKLTGSAAELGLVLAVGGLTSQSSLRSSRCARCGPPARIRVPAGCATVCGTRAAASSCGCRWS
jgi:hypothetical protein